MPIAVKVVSEQAFNAWVDDAKKKFAGGGQDRTAVANNQSAEQP